MSATQSTSANQSDLLLWIAGGAIAAVASAWLVITQPWSGGTDVTVASQAAGAVTETIAPALKAPSGDTPPVQGADGALDNPLRMAQLAYDAGMLIEPDEFSAWTLFSRVLSSEPDNATAREGLTKVADDLVRRGETALDQGRFDDARALVARIGKALPEHGGARALARRIRPEPAAAAAAPATPQPKETLAASVQTPTPNPAPQPTVDPLIEANKAFEEAMAQGRLLTPTQQSAKYYAGELARLSVDDELTKQARTKLSLELLSRAAQSIEALDPEAAGIWIDEAEALLGATDDGVRKARSALTEQLIAMESAKPVPASMLKIATYVAPVFPQRASERKLEGWVDIEFTVGTDGHTRNVVVTDASHEALFRREATEAVAKWQFEPRVFLGREIEQTSYTRIRFVP